METKVCKECGRELPVENFKMSRWGGRVDVCTECATRKLRENKAKRKEAERVEKEQKVQASRNLKLCEFTPRELMQELARRGYKGTLQYVQIHEIDIENF